LPSSEARSNWKGSWQPSKADIDGLEASLPQLVGLKADERRRIEHPERYFRQYLGIIRDGKKLIYVNAPCQIADARYWREHLVSVFDGGSCYWQAYLRSGHKTISNSLH